MLFPYCNDNLYYLIHSKKIVLNFLQNYHQDACVLKLNKLKPVGILTIFFKGIIFIEYILILTKVNICN